MLDHSSNSNNHSQSEKPAQASSQAVGIAKPTAVTCADGKTFEAAEARLVASVSSIRSRDSHRPAVVGEFPVLVEQSGNYRMFTYSRRIASIAH